MTIQVTASLTISYNEITFQFTRSSGPGGQNVNKVSTRVELLFDVKRSLTLTEEEKERVFARLRSRIDSDGVLHVAAQESRSQWRNREIVVEKFAELLRAALAVNKKRKPTRPSRASAQSRIQQKKTHGTRKKLRGRVNLSGD